MLNKVFAKAVADMNALPVTQQMGVNFNLLQIDSKGSVPNTVKNVIAIMNNTAAYNPVVGFVGEFYSAATTPMQLAVEAYGGKIDYPLKTIDRSALYSRSLITDFSPTLFRRFLCSRTFR